MSQIKTGDDLLTALAEECKEDNSTPHLVGFLTRFPVAILREAADLCGIDSVDMSKKSAISVIISNF